MSKVMHIWGTPLYLGMGIVKFTTALNQEIKMESLLDIVQLEWSLDLADYVLLALRYKIRRFQKWECVIHLKFN